MRGKIMYKAEVYASGNRESAVRTFYVETYSWPAMSAALGGVREDFAWLYGNPITGRKCCIREPQVGETLEYKLGTEAQFVSGFTGWLVLSSTSDD